MHSPRAVPAAQRCACAVLTPRLVQGPAVGPPGLYAVSRFQPLVSRAARSAGSAGIPAAGRRRSSSKWWPRGCGHCPPRAAVPGGAARLPRVPLAGAGGFRLRPKILLVNNIAWLMAIPGSMWRAMPWMAPDQAFWAWLWRGVPVRTLVMLSMWWTKTSLPAKRCTDCHFSVARSGVPMPSRRWWSLCCLVWSLERSGSWLR